MDFVLARTKQKNEAKIKGQCQKHILAHAGTWLTS